MRKPRGGAYSEVRRSWKSGEIHHAPAASVSRLSRDEGPAIWMSKRDHRKTASYGSSRSARRYREKQRELIEAGNFKKAFEMDIRDIRRKFGNKYDEAIKQARQYAKKQGFFD